jgi:hypothetical protein
VDHAWKPPPSMGVTVPSITPPLAVEVVVAECNMFLLFTEQYHEMV